MWFITSCSFEQGIPNPGLTREGAKEAQRMFDELVNISRNPGLYDMVIAVGEGRRHFQTADILFDRAPKIIDRRLGIAEISCKNHLIVSDRKKIPLEKVVKNQEFRSFCKSIVPFVKSLIMQEETREPIVAIGNCMVIAATGIPHEEVKSASIYKIVLTDEQELRAKKVF